MRISLLVWPALFHAAAQSAMSQSVQVEVDSVRKQIVVTAGPLNIPPSAYGAHFNEEYRRFSWPTNGWVRGYEVDIVDSLGAKLPRELFHHAGMANLERRSLIAPLMERVFAAGRETEPVMLPGSMGVPLNAGDKISLYYALVNSGADAVTGARLRFTFAWIPEGTTKISKVLPVYLTANSLSDSITFDAPPGVSSTVSEFTMPVSGRFRAMGAHMHDYAREIRLEDAETNSVLVRLRAELTPGGKIVSMSRTKFILSRGGLRLTANRRYRIVAVYDNPTCAVAHGMMGLMVGPFIPDNLKSWPSLESADARVKQDLENLKYDSVSQHHHSEGPAETEYPTDKPSQASGSCK